MKQEWIKILTQITDNLDNVDQIKCPVCGEHGIDYIYIGDEGTRVGFLQIWCNQCLREFTLAEQWRRFRQSLYPLRRTWRELFRSMIM